MIRTMAVSPEDLKQQQRSFWIFLGLGIFMALMPIGQEPHLWQKLVLLKNGWLKDALDWFDLLLHSGPLLGALAYGVRILIISKKAKNSPED